MAPAVRELVWARVQDAARAATTTAVRRRVSHSIEWLREHALEESVVPLDARSYWTRTGIALRPGDRFRIEAHGLLAIQRAAVASGPEAAADLFGPEGRELPPHDMHRMSALIARVGRHEIPAPIDPDQVFVAQDEGELVVRIAPANLEALDDSGVECGSAFPTDVVSTVPVSGLLLVRAEKLP